MLTVTMMVVSYLTAIYTWPWLREKINGVEAELADLRSRVVTVQAKVERKKSEKT